MPAPVDERHPLLAARWSSESTGSHIAKASNGAGTRIESEIKCRLCPSKGNTSTERSGDGNEQRARGGKSGLRQFWVEALRRGTLRLDTCRSCRSRCLGPPPLGGHATIVKTTG